MWPFTKKKKEDPKAQAAADDADEEEEQKPAAAENSDLSTKIEMIQAELTKINGNIESFKEMRKSTTERFGTINEQIGELRGMVNDAQRTVGTIEVKATKAADLVESVHPDKLMIQVQKEDGKIEGLRGMLEAKEDMMKNLMDQLKKLRDQVNVFRGVEQVIKLNEEVKDELMNVKKISATVERHADRVENVFLEAQKSFEAFNTFADKLESLRSDLKELSAKVDKLEVANMANVKKKDFDEKIETIEKFDKRVKKVLEEIETYASQVDSRFKKLEVELKGDFSTRLERAEIISKAFDDTLSRNPLFAEGLHLQDYMRKSIGTPVASSSAEAKSSASGGATSASGEGGSLSAKNEAPPDKKLTEGMTPVRT